MFENEGQNKQKSLRLSLQLDDSAFSFFKSFLEDLIFFKIIFVFRILPVLIILY
jgi:hypothetical protein